MTRSLVAPTKNKQKRERGRIYKQATRAAGYGTATTFARMVRPTRAKLVIASDIDGTPEANIYKLNAAGQRFFRARGSTENQSQLSCQDSPSVELRLDHRRLPPESYCSAYRAR